MKPRTARTTGVAMRERRPGSSRHPGAIAGARGLTLDTGVLIAFERADRGVAARLKEALVSGRKLTLPTVVLAEGAPAAPGGARGGGRSARVLWRR